MTVRALRRGSMAGRGQVAGPLVSDSFDRADGALGTADVGGAWTAVAGTWAISSQRAKITYGNSGVMCVAMLPAGTGPTQCAAMVDIQLSPGGTARAGLALRGTDASSFLVIDLVLNSGANQLSIGKRLATSTWWVTTTETLVAGNGYTLTAVVTNTGGTNGLGTVTAYVNEVNAGSYSFTAQDNTDLPGTRAGFRTWDDASDEDGNSTYNDLTVSSTATFTPRAPALLLPPVATAIDATSASIAWNTAGNGGSPLTSYTVTSSGGQVFTGISASATSYTASGLTTDLAQTFTVTAINAVGSRISAASNSVTPTAGGGIVNGQQITSANVGRVGAAAAAVANYSSTLTTISTAQTYSTTQTIRNTRFTNTVDVTGGTVTFEFCQFAAQPASAAYALRQYNNGADAGIVVCNWCDFDSGLRGTAGNFESTGFQAGERGSGSTNPMTTGSRFALYRCGVQGYGNGLGMHRWRSAASSTVTECWVQNLTSGGGTHVDGVEVYSSGNIIIQRCRIVLISDDQSCINIATAFDTVPDGYPVTIQNNYFNGGTEPVLAQWYGQPAPGPLRGVSFIGNWFGDLNSPAFTDYEADFAGMNCTYNLAYATADNTTLYWAWDNVWAPNGEGITNPATMAELPHTGGKFLSSAQWGYGGSGSANAPVLVGGAAANHAPYAPSAATATAGDTSVTVTWSAPTGGTPSSNGGSTILDYTITAYVASTGQPAGRTGTSATSPGSVTSLTNGTTYYFTVKARNALGYSIESGPSNTVTPAGGGSSSFPDATNTGYLNAPGYPGSLTAATNNIVSNTVYNFRDFGGIDCGRDGAPVSNVTFNGCRFRLSGKDEFIVLVKGTNITFNYCTFMPASISTPPADLAQGYQWAIVADWGYSTFAWGLYVNNCDIWGFGNAIVIQDRAGGTPDYQFRDNWIHDACTDYYYHTDGIGHLNGSGEATNVLIDHNTIESAGSTNAIAFQQGSTYDNITVTNNLLGGFGYTVQITPPATNVTFTDNTFSTRLLPDYGPLYDTGFLSPGNWRRNRWHVPAGAAWGSPAHDGWYWMPVVSTSQNDTTYVSQTDYTG